MLELYATNAKYTKEQLVEIANISANTLSTWGLTESTDALTISELKELAVSDKQAKVVLEKIRNQQMLVASNSELIASNNALAGSEITDDIAAGAIGTVFKSNLKKLTGSFLGKAAIGVTFISFFVKAVNTATDVATKGINSLFLNKLKENAEQSASKYTELASNVDALNQELDKNKQLIIQISGKENLSYTDEEEIKKLNEANNLLEKRIENETKLRDLNLKQKTYDYINSFKGEASMYIDEDDLKILQSGIDAGNYDNKALQYESSEKPKNLMTAITQYSVMSKLLNETTDPDNIEAYQDILSKQESYLLEYLSDLYERQANIQDYYDIIKDKDEKELNSSDKEVLTEYDQIENAIQHIMKLQCLIS